MDHRAVAPVAVSGRALAPAALILGVGLLGVATMPGQFMSGDPSVWRQEARSILVAGELNIPAATAAGYGEPGRYVVRNERSGLYYSKYGVMNSIVSIPPLWLEITAGPALAAAQIREYPLLIFNLWNAALCAILAALLYAAAGAITSRPWLRAVFAVATMYCTSLWYYLRAQSSEIYQVIFFTALYLCLAAFLRRLGEGRLDRRAWLMLGGVWGLAACLVLSRVVYGLLLPIVVVLAIHVFLGTLRGEQRRKATARLAAALLIPPCLIVLLLGWVNAAKFGAPWLTGYHQWRPEDHLPTWNVVDGVWGYLFSGRFSVFLNFPPLALGLFALAPFLRRFPLESKILGATFLVFLVVLGSIPSWAGEFAYGPRYLLFILPLLSLPSILLAERLIRDARGWAARAGGIASLAALASSAYLQVQANRLPFWTFYQARVVIEFPYSPVARAYFGDHLDGVALADLLRHRDDLDRLPYFDEFRRNAPPGFVAEYRALMSAMIARGNWFWSGAR